MTYIPVVTPSASFVDLTGGDVNGKYFSINRFGHNDTVGTTEEILWSEGGATYAFPTSADTVTIVSTSAQDNSGGTGARSVTVYGLNSSWAATSEIIVPNGTTPVNGATQFWRINRIIVGACGSNQANVGKITCTHTTSGGVLASVIAERGRGSMMVYSVPTGWTFGMYTLRVYPESTKTIDAYLYIRTGINGAALTRQQIWQVVGATASERAGTDSGPWTRLTGPADIYMTAKNSSGTAYVSAQWTGVLCDDSL